MADVKCKPFSFYVPEHDTDLMRFMAFQSNMSLSMRLLMKAFLAANRNNPEIDVSTMDLGDLIRSVKIDLSILDGPVKGRGNQAVQEAREAALIERHGNLLSGQDAPTEAPTAQAITKPVKHELLQDVPQEHADAGSSAAIQANQPLEQVPANIPAAQTTYTAAAPQPQTVVRQPAGTAADLDPASMMGDDF